MLRHTKNMFLLLLAAAHFGAAAEAVQAPWVQPATVTALGPQSVLTAIARAGDRLVAVGERGTIILSDDQGRNWRQAKAPVSVTLCAVRFIDPQRGWAVGHSGVILVTQDGGVSWAKQLDGRQIPALIRAEAVATGLESVARTADQSERDGPDKPVLDIMFVDALHGWAVGGYGLFLHTEDGGKSWVSRMAAVDNQKGLSIYAIATDGRSTYLAGEQGYFALGEAATGGFKRVGTPVQSSYFTMLTESGRVVIGGLGGVLLDSVDNGASWRRIETGTSASIVTAQWNASHDLLVASQVGEVMTADLRHGARLRNVAVSAAGTLHAFALASENQLVTVGFRGVVPLTLTDAQQQNVVQAK